MLRDSFINAAENLQPTSYDETYKQSMTAKAIAAGDKDVQIELPEQAFQAGTPENHRHCLLTLERIYLREYVASILSTLDLTPN
jgi:hypothetical protein